MDKTRPYSSNMINDHKIQGEWKIQITTEISFKDSNKTRTMHTKSDNIEIMIQERRQKSERA